MQFEVPQFIEIEDKIIGPLTWKQFIYVAGGAGLVVILFLSLSFIPFILIGLPVGALAGALAFYKVNDRPFTVVFEAAVNYLTGARLYLWQRSEIQSVIVKPEKVVGPPVATPSIGTSHLRELSDTLEAQG